MKYDEKGRKMREIEKLKKLLDDNRMSVKKLGKYTGIPPTTLYSILKRNSSIRYENAVRIANVFGIQPIEICSADVVSQELMGTEECPYCRTKTMDEGCGEDFFREEYDFGILGQFEVSVCIYPKDAQLSMNHLFITSEGEQVLKINYCPICGRRLVGRYYRKE